MNLATFFKIDIGILIILFFLYKQYKTHPCISIKIQNILIYSIYERGATNVTKDIEVHYYLYIENSSSRPNTIKKVRIYFEDSKRTFEEGINLSAESYKITALTLENVCFPLPDYRLRKKYRTEIRVFDQHNKSYSRTFSVKVPQKYLAS